MAKALVQFISKIIRPLLSIAGIFMIAVLVALWIALILALFIGMPFAGFAFPGSSMTTFLGTFNILFIVGIPLLMIVLFIMRVFMKSNFRPKWQFGLWAFWIINVISMAMIGVSTAKDFQHGAEPKISEETFSLSSDTLAVEMEESPYRRSWLHFGNEILISDEKLIAKSIQVIFEKSKSNSVEVIQKNEAWGRSLSESEQLAESINYNYRLEGNKLILPSYFTLTKGTKWRSQQVLIYVHVPEGMYVNRNNLPSRYISRVNEDDDSKFPSYWDNKYIWRMGSNGMVAPEYIADYKKEFSFKDFSKIRLEGDIELNIKRGDRYSIVLDESDYQNELQVTHTDGRLDISSPNSNESFKIEITMPHLEELWAIRSGDIEIRDFKLDNLHVVNEGEGHINAFADIKNFDVHLTGNNELDIRGEGEFLNAVLSDDAELDAEHFTVKKANLELDNGSLAKVSATDTLWKKVIDSEVISRRTPVMIEKN